ncbi:MAG: O-antigen ligase family protein [Candidatus Daviesbacteria bacterium]|nr:O-antigen ligase family protein [Candidatus Daviesbacteria bacterium]
MSKLKKVEEILLFLTLLFLPTQLGKHFWPQFSYVYSLKVDYLSPTVYFWDILMVGLFVVWILQKPKVNKTGLNLFLFFLITQGLSLFGAFNMGAGLVRLEQYTIAGFFGVYLASAEYKGLLNKIYLPISLGILGESVLAILQFIKGGTLGLWVLGERAFSISTPGIAKFDFFGLQFLRPYGTFSHPNVLAGFALLTLVILSVTKDMTKLYSSANRLRMTIRLAAVLLAGFTIFLTMSRTAIAAGFISALILFKRKWLVLMGVLLLVLSPILFTRFSSLFNFDNLTLLRREELIESAGQIFLRHPFFGVGLNNFIPTVASDLTIGPSRFLQPVHNIFLLALSETGLVGLIGLVFLIGFPILSSLRKQGSINNWYRFRSVGRPIKSGMTVLPWLIIIFLGMFDHYFLTLPQGYRLLFLVWGLSFSMLKCWRE